MAEDIAKWKLYSLMIIMLFTGASNTVLQKVQNEMETYDSDHPDGIKYKHPFFQTFTMAIAELLCLVVYKIYKFKANRQYGGFDKRPEIIEARKKGLRTDINVLLLAIPSGFDMTGSCLMFLALTIIAASIYQMLRGLIVFLVAILSIIFLKRRLFRHHWSALSLILIGLALVGATPVIYPDSDDEDDKGKDELYLVIFGIALVVVAQCLAAGQSVSEEVLFNKYYLHPLQVVGWEGVYGVLVTGTLLVIFQFIKCNNDDICPYGTLEDTPRALSEWTMNDGLWIVTIFYIICVATFNCMGASVTKYASATQRSTISCSRTAVIWMFFIFYQGPGHEKFIWLELVGFLLLALGTFMYNEILVFPCLGFNKYTKEALMSAEDCKSENLLTQTSNDSDIPAQANLQNKSTESPNQGEYDRNIGNTQSM